VLSKDDTKKLGERRGQNVQERVEKDAREGRFPSMPLEEEKNIRTGDRKGQSLSYYVIENL